MNERAHDDLQSVGKMLQYKEAGGAVVWENFEEPLCIPPATFDTPTTDDAFSIREDTVGRIGPFGSFSRQRPPNLGLGLNPAQRRFSSNFGSFDCFHVLIDWWLTSASSRTMRSHSSEIESMIR
jgi:hypothetical protein